MFTLSVYIQCLDLYLIHALLSIHVYFLLWLMSCLAVFRLSVVGIYSHIGQFCTSTFYVSVAAFHCWHWSDCSFYTVRWNRKPPSKDMTENNKTQLLHSNDFVKEVFVRPFLDRLQMSACALHLPDFTTLFLAFSRTSACVRRPPKDIRMSRDDQQVPETDVVSCHKPQINFGLFTDNRHDLKPRPAVTPPHCSCLALLLLSRKRRRVWLTCHEHNLEFRDL